MLDIKYIKENKELVETAARNKGVDVSIKDVIKAHDELLALQQKKEKLQSKINEASNKIKTGEIEDKNAIIQETKDIKIKLKKIDNDFKIAEIKYYNTLQNVPNIPSSDTHIGKDEKENEVLKKVGDIPTFDFKIKPHWDIGQKLDIIDNERAAKISGARFTFIKRELALLQFALIQYTLSFVTNEKNIKKIIKDENLKIESTPFIPIVPPVIIKGDTYRSMERLEPEEDKYKIANKDEYLIGSAEHSIGPLHMNETFEEISLPIRYIGYSTCFRKEAGSYGKDTKGILRMHQFDKLEMESFSTEDTGNYEQELLVAIQERLMQGIKIPYQVVRICTGDMGMPDYRQIDIEAWMPGQNLYRETHSADYVTDYQSRRLKTYVKRANNKKELVHMNDATAFAIGRTLIAIIENYQESDGSIRIPKVLQQYMHGVKKIEH